MYPPAVDYPKLQQAQSRAEHLLERYKSNLLGLKAEANCLIKEVAATKAIIELTERSTERREILRDCYRSNEYYDDFLGGEKELSSHRLFLSTLQARHSSYSKLIESTQAAIDLLEKDMAAMATIAGTPFRQLLHYYTMPANGWSLSFIAAAPSYHGSVKNCAF